MKKILLSFLSGMFSVWAMYSQQTILRGSVKDASTMQPIENVSVSIEETQLNTVTNAFGEFEMTAGLPLGEQILRISKIGYITRRYPVVINENQLITISDMTLEIDNALSKELFAITLSDDQLDNEDSGADNISGLLASSLDIFQKTAAFEFSSAFYRLRGLDSEHSSILLNGIEMNKIFNGRPQWSNWGGINDVIRNQELALGLSPSRYNFGGLLGTTNINLRPSEARPGGRVTYSFSNRSYTNRLMVSYVSGLNANGLAYSISLGKRWGEEGFQNATSYDAYSFFVSVEKKFNDAHSLNLVSIFTPNRRGKSSPNTQEVYDLKGIKYNEYWGWQNGEMRNSRIKEVAEPLFIINHFWKLDGTINLSTNLAYQFGKVGNSRLAYGGATRIFTPDGQEYFEGSGKNPSPVYYQKLPSYFVRNFPSHLEFAYGAQQDFLRNGQIDWSSMYEANLTNWDQGKNASYIFYEDRNDDKQWTLNSILNAKLNELIDIDASINYQKLKSENFAKVLDLLGGNGFLNIDSFEGTQFDMNDPNKLLGVGDIYNYHYTVFANKITAFAQANLQYRKMDVYISGNLTNTTYQREGLFRTEPFADKSYGKGESLSFTGFSTKAGFTYKLSGKHLLNGNIGYISQAPSIGDSYTNLRYNNNSVPNISEEKMTSVDASYIFRSPFLKAKLTGFHTLINDANEISFYYAEGIGNVITGNVDEATNNNNSKFIQEILQGINKKHVGVEFGIEAQVLPAIKLKSAGSFGEFTFNNNPNLYVSSNSFENIYLGKSLLKNYRLPAGPQQAYSFGFEYSDTDYWWFGATANFFYDTFIDISPLTRTNSFYTDVDGLPFLDYDENIARDVLQPERFEDYMVVNVIGGKSWKINQYYISFFASINNILNEVYKTGGFEQGRNANYRLLRDDKSLATPVFGSKYWYGRGTNYFFNINIRF